MGTPYININGITKVNTPRSWSILRLNYFGEFVDVNNYDIFGNYLLTQNAIDLINNTPDGYTICIGTNDEPLQNSGGLRTVLKTFGFKKLDFVYRCAWLGIFQKGANSILSEKYIASGVVSDTILIPNIVSFPMDGTTKSLNGIDCIHSNCTLTNYGIYVEEGTTNLLAKEYAINSGKLNGHINKTKIIPGLFKENAQQFDGSEDNNSGFFIPNTSSLCSVGKTYTISVYVKLYDDSNFRIMREGTGGTTVLADNSIIGRWQRVIATWTENTNRSGELCFYGNGIKDICCMQLEEKPYSTAYVNGTRPNSDNGVQIPTSFLSFPFSVTMDVFPDIQTGVNSIYGSEPHYMYIAGLWTNIGGYKGEIHQYYRNNIKNGLENGFKYTIVFRQNNYDIYINNNKIVNNSGYYSGTFNLSNIPMFTVGCRGYEAVFGYANALYKNIAFYNRELIQGDINKLCNKKSAIDKYGNINGLELIENNKINLINKSMSNQSVDTISNNSHSGWGFIINHSGKNFNIQLKENQIYTVSFVAWCESDTVLLYNDFYPDTLPEKDVTITTTPTRYVWTMSTTNTAINNCQFRFWDFVDNNKVYITDIKIQEGTSNKMSITKENLFINELIEGSDF